MKAKTRKRACDHNGNKNGAKWLRRERRLAIYIRDGFQCLCCRRDLRDAEPGQITLDHIVPRSRGGSNESGNLYTCCNKCNSARQNRPIREWASPGACSRIAIQSARPLNIQLAKALLCGASADTQSDASTYAKACRAAKEHAGV